MRLLVPATLAGVSVLLLGAIAYEGLAPLAPVAVEVPRIPKTIATAAPSPTYIPPPESDFADIDARPLFSSARKPLADSTQATATQAASSDFALAGVIMDANRAVALVRSRSANTTTSVVLGDTVAGWHVVKIEATAVTLHGNGSDAIIPLDGPAARPPGAPLAPAASSPVAAPVATAPQPPSAATAAPAPATPAIVPSTSPPPATTTAPVTAAAPPAKPYHPYINPEALKGAWIDPKTGEPTL